MTKDQLRALINIHRNFHVDFNPDDADRLFTPQWDLPDGYVAGWVGDKIYVGVDSEGRVSS